MHVERFMDRIAVISDIHGNMPVLKSLLSDIKSRGINRIMCLGDLAGKGPSSAAVVDVVKENCEAVERGIGIILFQKSIIVIGYYGT